MGDKVFRFIRRLAAFLIIFNIVTGSLYPVADSLDIGISDKLQHFIAYMALAFVLGLSSRSLAVRMVYFVLAAGLGGVIEIIQPYVGRNMSLYDFLADFAGVVCGGVLGILMRPVIISLLPLRRT